MKRESQARLPVWAPVVRTAVGSLAMAGGPAAVVSALTTCLPRRVDAKPAGGRDGNAADGRDG